MKLSSNVIPTCMAGLSLLFIAGCTDTGSVEPTTSAAIPEDISSALSGPLMVQTGSTVTRGVRTDVVNGSTFPDFIFTTDTATNTVGDEYSGNDIPDVIYDDKGRGIEIKKSPSALPYVVTYNDDDTIAAITKELSSGETALLAFNYEGEKLTNKLFTRKKADGEITARSVTQYSYDTNDQVVRAELINTLDDSISKSYDFTTDDNGRVSQVQEYDESQAASFRYVMTYDANGNIIKLERFNAAGALLFTNEYTYKPSSELALNLIGFFAATNPAFLPTFDLHTF